MSDTMEAKTQSGGNEKHRFFLLLAFGGALVLVAVSVLFVTSNRADLIHIASGALIIDAEEDLPASDGTLVAAHGMLLGNEPLGDGMYFQPGTYLRIERTVEMYAWIEQTHADGSASYTKAWTTSPTDSVLFQNPQGHNNPPEIIESLVVAAGHASIGRLSIDPQSLALPGAELIRLSEENISDLHGATIEEERYIFVGRGTIDVPWIGDMRIFYRGVPTEGEAVVFGALEGDALVPYTYKDGLVFYRLFYGTHEGALAALKSNR